VDTELDVLAESSVELVELLTVLGDLVEHLKRLLDDILADNLHDLVLLKSLTGQVEREILRIDNTLDEAEPLRNEIGAVISDEYTANVELDVVLSALGLKEIEGSALGNKEDSLELELALNGEVLDGEVVLPIVGKRLVEGGVLLSRDVRGVASPDGLVLVELLLLLFDLLDLLGLLLLLLLVVINLIGLLANGSKFRLRRSSCTNLLDLGLLVVISILGLLLLIGNLSLDLLGHVEEDGVRDELGVLLDDLLNLSLLEVLLETILDVEDDSGTAANAGRLLIKLDGERTTGAGLPEVLLCGRVSGTGHQIGY
jgi:hypothetical protein